jgi:3-oxoacyl-[acyl-carrier protein] reductase
MIRNTAIERTLMAGTGLLDGQVAVVTGGSQGIGAAIVARLTAEGAAVASWDLRRPASGEDGGTAAFVECDVSDETSVAEALRATEQALGPVTSLINNAGITRDALLRDLSVDGWDAVMAVNLRGPFLTTKAVAVGMRDRQRGTIVNISSLGGKVGTVGQTNYSASKAGIIGLTKASAKELARYSVRVNAIQPGLIKTPMTEALRPDIYEMKLKEVPLRRAGEPDEIGWGCVFLTSDMSTYITGVVLEIGGGRYI